MKERTILFNGEMVRAILAGHKTQTRRPFKRQPPSRWKFTGNYKTDLGYPSLKDKLWAEFCIGGDKTDPAYFQCPYGVVGERFWVREIFGHDPYGHMDGHEKIIYRATQKIDPDYPIKWKPSIHMPRWASRITLEITDIRVERIQEISGNDAIAEGIKTLCLCPDGDVTDFAFFWDSTNDNKYLWKDNPWVWVIEFKRVKLA